MRTVLVTGSAGFIGYFTARALLKEGWRVIGVDARTDYYDVTLKDRRAAKLAEFDAFTDVQGRIETPGLLADLFEAHAPVVVIHLAAQAGVRHSIDAPRTYVDANLVGTFEVLEAARAHPPQHLLMASTSSAYGAATQMPYVETMAADAQMSFYAATKKATESMAHSYAHLYRLPITAFRFFTVYGPWGRPDMAHFKFTKAILNGDPIDVYNGGKMSRDFTYIDDLIAALMALLDAPPGDTPVSGDSLSAVAPYRLINIGTNTPVPLTAFISAIERACGRTADRRLLPMQPGDVPATWADTQLLETLIGTRPATPLQDGIDAFVAWYRDYYQI